jgi:hypothetical protein
MLTSMYIMSQELKTLADALSCFNNHEVLCQVLDLIIDHFTPPWDVLGAGKKMNKESFQSRQSN